MGRSRHVYWVCGFAALILGFDLFCWHRIAEQIASKNYPMVTGRVTHAQPVDQPTNFLSETVPFGYSYRVHGKGYAGSMYRYVQTAPPTEFAAQLSFGKDIPVYYNPDNPADAVLSRELVDEDYGRMLQLVFLNLMLFSFLGLWMRWRVRMVFPAHQIWQS